MSGDDFYDKSVRVKDILGPLYERGVQNTDPETRRILDDIRTELRAIHWHLAEITGNDPEEIRKDVR